MAGLGIRSFTLEVPNLAAGVKFYSDAGLIPDVDGNVARFRCPGQDRHSVVLRGGADRKRLHHLALRADNLPNMATMATACGGKLIAPPEGCDASGLWIADPHGMTIHLEDVAPDLELAPAPPFTINAPGHVIRVNRSAVLPLDTYPPAKPLRLGHVLVFTPDVSASVAFATGALGMGLADRSQNIIAFCCARRHSDHHVLAFALSSGVGFHHGSFQVNDPDEVGRGGRALHDKTGKGEWGFGRHTIGSNYFHYVQDPWGSWFEYYADMDFIGDYRDWSPTNYDLKDSLASWGPAVPPDFVHNYEAA